MEGRWTCRCGRVNADAVSSCPRCGRSPGGEPPLLRAGGRLGLDPARKPVVVGTLGALVVVGLFIAGVATLRSLTGSGSAAPPPTRPSAAANARVQVEDVVLQLEGFVARTRGLQFKAPVKVKLLEGRAFLTQLEARSAAGAFDLPGQEATLRALRLLPGGVDPNRARERALDRVVGFYDAGSKQLFVKGASTTPYVRSVLVHELTHALQDQNFGLTGRGRTDNDADLAARAVVEGDAEQTARSYVATLPPADQDAVRREAPARADDIYNQAYATSVDAFPYVVGLAWADAVRAAGGQPALDDAFRAFPQSSAELIHPDRYLARVAPRAVSPPVADGTVVDRGVVGEYQLIYLLTRAIDDQDAFEIAQAWGGSHYVTWQSGGRSCTRARFAMLSTAADRALAAALRVWAETNGATLEGGGPVTLTACSEPA